MKALVNIYVLFLLEIAALLNALAYMSFRLAVIVKACKREIRELKACYQIPITECVEMLMIEASDAWSFRNEILAADRG